VMVRFDIAGSKALRGKKKLGMWNGHYFPSKILCFFVLPDDETTYAIIQSTSSSNHENDSILFERWELEESLCYQKNGKNTSIQIFTLSMLIVLVILFLQSWMIAI